MFVLRDQLGKLQLGLQVLQAQRTKEKSEKKQESATAPVRKMSTQIPTMWRGLAEQQKRRREEAERDNVLLERCIVPSYNISGDAHHHFLTQRQMAFLEDDDAVRAFEAALSFVEQYSIDTSVFTAAPSAAGLSPSLASDDDMELLSPSLPPLAPPLPARSASPGTGSDSSTTSSSSPVFKLSKAPPARLELGLPAAGQASTKRTSVARGRKKAPGGPKKPVTRGDPNRARNERKIELAYLREKVAQMELELRALHLHPRKQTRAIRHDAEKQQRDEALKPTRDTDADSAMSLYEPVQVPTVWKEVASRQRRRREKAERENVRLKLILENQTKMAKGLESLLQKRSKQQVVECSSLSQTKKSKYSQGRTLDFRADVTDFKDLLAHLDRAYREVDAVFAANGLAAMETTRRDARMREGADCMYLDIFANKVMPFGMRATAQAVWDHFKGAEKHRGNMYEGKVAKHLDTPDTIIEDFAKEFFADSARADFHAKQVLRRYVEEDREIVIWVASVVPLEFDDQRVKGLGFRHQGYAVTKRAKASTPKREFSLLQLCSLVSPEKEDHTVYDPAAVRALTDFMLGTVAGNITASQELIENVLMDQAVKP
ncbi:hypothetical protein PHYPSEUDO_005549 [Phytophthora pseudosyringae]|uniref:M96 mating-specific protein family n=1 Tax=Phytophthora pseudosyringae TaxID=221518 RepID=A0A8T1WF32_9STRA|nr:hypothetical protein PHYPSEUDO_005549 [Phytophthora pseudosyringae]